MDVQTLDMIKVIVPSVAAIVSSAAVIAKTYFDNKKRSKIDEKRDERTNIRMDKFENTVNNIQITNSRIENDVKETKAEVLSLKESSIRMEKLHQYTSYDKKIQADILTQIEVGFSDSKVKDENFKDILINAATKFHSVVKIILDSNFSESTVKNIHSLLTNAAKDVKIQINFDKFEYDNFKEFMHTCKVEIIEPEFLKFSSGLGKLTEPNTPEYKQEIFYNLCISLTSSIQSQILSRLKNLQK